MTTTPAVPVPIEATVITPAADSLVKRCSLGSPQENRERGPLPGPEIGQRRVATRDAAREAYGQVGHVAEDEAAP